MLRRLARALRGFPPALRGLAHLVASERHARFHLVATVGVAVLAAWLRVGRDGALWLVVAVALVWSAEAQNSAVERLADRVSTARDPLIGRAKDLGAAGVLCAALAAAVIGALVLGPPLWARFGGG